MTRKSIHCASIRLVAPQPSGGQLARALDPLAEAVALVVPPEDEGGHPALDELEERLAAAPEASGLVVVARLPWAPAGLEDLAPNRWRTLRAWTLDLAFRAARTGLRPLIARRGGRLQLIAPAGGSPAEAAVREGLIGLTRSLELEVGRRGITVEVLAARRDEAPDALAARLARGDIMTVALVTGASRGIGRAIALALAGQGADVAVGCSRDREGAQRTLAAVRRLGRQGRVVACDIAAAAAVREAVEQTVAALGGLDIVVCNAGTRRDGLLVTLADGDWERVLAVNLDGAVNVLYAALPHLERSGCGRAVLVSSAGALGGNRGQTSYTAAKGALHGLARSLAIELAGRGITMNVVAPGWVPTALTESVIASRREAVLEDIPAGRLGTAEEVAALVAFLCREEAGYLTGQVIAMDGGWSLRSSAAARW